jgi:methyl-accepting chemotaxis protein
MPTHETIELACIAVTALALVTQTIILLAIALGASKSIKALKEEIEDMRASIMPTVHNVRDLVDRLSPKVEQTVTDISEFASGLRKQAEEVQVVAGEVLARVRTETGRIDNMFSGTLDAVDKASNFVTQAVSKPIRQISGILASLKAIIESLSTAEPPYRGPSGYKDSTHNDKDMFI